MNDSTGTFNSGVLEAEGMRIVLFPVEDDGETGGITGERMWAFYLGGDTYRVESVPFFVDFVSAGDIISAPIGPSDERPVFACVIERSGNSTLRICFDEDQLNQEGSPPDVHLQRISWAGFEFEHGGSVVAINIPPSADVALLCAYFDQHDIAWDQAYNTSCPYAELES